MYANIHSKDIIYKSSYSKIIIMYDFSFLSQTFHILVKMDELSKKFQFWCFWYCYGRQLGYITCLFSQSKSRKYKILKTKTNPNKLKKSKKNIINRQFFLITFLKNKKFNKHQN